MLRNDMNFIAGNTLALLIDVQEKFIPAIPDFANNGSALTATQKIITGTQALSVPWLISEQVPDKLGRTITPLGELLADVPRYGKTTFSLLDDTVLRNAIADSNRDTLFLCGLETHACVLSTVDDALRRGYRVVVAPETVASRHEDDRTAALKTMRQLGALVLPLETVLLRLCRDAAHPAFRQISRLIR
jgi:nicotinamidase-related amidase